MIGILRRHLLTCRDCVELVTEYEEDALDGRGRRRVERHLKICRECTEHVEGLRVTVRSLDALPPEPADPEVRDHLLALYREQRGAEPR